MPTYNLDYERVKYVAVRRLVDEGLLESAPVKQPSAIKLLGAGAVFDSLGLVNYLLELEEGLTTEFKSQVILMDERAMSQTRSPFLNLETLIDFILTILPKEQAVG